MNTYQYTFDSAIEMIAMCEQFASNIGIQGNTTDTMVTEEASEERFRHGKVVAPNRRHAIDLILIHYAKNNGQRKTA